MCVLCVLWMQGGQRDTNCTGMVFVPLGDKVLGEALGRGCAAAKLALERRDGPLPVALALGERVGARDHRERGAVVAHDHDAVARRPAAAAKRRRTRRRERVPLQHERIRRVPLRVAPVVVPDVRLRCARCHPLRLPPVFRAVGQSLGLFFPPFFVQCIFVAPSPDRHLPLSSSRLLASARFLWDFPAASFPCPHVCVCGGVSVLCLLRVGVFFFSLVH